MARFGICADCGRRVRGNYARCYNCNLRCRRVHWHDPEDLQGQDERDAARFEAAMQSLRDQRAQRFREITALAPVPLQ